MKRYDILESISQGEDGTLSSENATLVRVANDIRRAVEHCRDNETESCSGREYVMWLNEQEKRCAEGWAKDHGVWTDMTDIFRFGPPGPSGSESDTYIGNDGYIYKTNNLMHCGDSIICTLTKFIMFNQLFADSAYDFVGFAGFEGRSVYPVVKQRYILNCKPASRIEIGYFMASLGFNSVGDGIYENSKFILKDILPKNVLRDETGDFYAIDAEIDLR